MANLGQHFLTDKNALRKISALLDLKENDFVIEIGPGHGELTEEIIEQFGNSAIKNWKIVAIEKDRQLADDLRKKIYDLGIKNVDIIAGDALKLLPTIVRGSKFEVRNYKIIGNIPYYITGKLLRTVGELQTKPSIFVMTIQKEVAERLVAKPPRMSRLAASVQFWTSPEIAFMIPKNSFHPTPEVDSATVVLTPIPQRKISDENYYKAVRALFGQPRKTVLNNLSDGFAINKKDVEEKLKNISINSNLRPQNLSIEEIIKIASVFCVKE